jgi:hypothetical protein
MILPLGVLHFAVVAVCVSLCCAEDRVRPHPVLCYPKHPVVCCALLCRAVLYCAAAA